jgi:histidinol-phosphate aminotransferase
MPNMMLVRLPGLPGTRQCWQHVFATLKAHRVLVKNVSKMHPLLANCLRLTVGTPDENEQLLAALTSALLESPA